MKKETEPGYRIVISLCRVYLFIGDSIHSNHHCLSLRSPNHQSSIHTAGAEPSHTTSTTLKDTDRVDGILMRGGQLRVVLGLALEIHLSEHIQGGFFPLSVSTAGFGFDRARNVPALLAATEPERFAVVSCGDYLGLTVPDQAGERQGLRADVDDGSWWLLWSTGIDDSDAAVMARKSKCITAR